jgi:hypothetical protein
VVLCGRHPAATVKEESCKTAAPLDKELSARFSGAAVTT